MTPQAAHRARKIAAGAVQKTFLFTAEEAAQLQALAMRWGVSEIEALRRMLRER